jgi:hypothetical protein
MEETIGGTTVPLRRGRAVRGAPATATRPAPEPTAASATTWTVPLHAMLVPPRLLWLAGLGGTAVTVRTARGVWARLLAEGSAAEAWLRRTLAQRAA